MRVTATTSSAFFYCTGRAVVAALYVILFLMSAAFPHVEIDHDHHDESPAHSSMEILHLSLHHTSYLPEQAEPPTSSIAAVAVAFSLPPLSFYHFTLIVPVYQPPKPSVA